MEGSATPPFPNLDSISDDEQWNWLIQRSVEIGEVHYVSIPFIWEPCVITMVACWHHLVRTPNTKICVVSTLALTASCRMILHFRAFGPPNSPLGGRQWCIMKSLPSRYGRRLEELEIYNVLKKVFLCRIILQNQLFRPPIPNLWSKFCKKGFRSTNSISKLQNERYLKSYPLDHLPWLETSKTAVF